MFALLLDLLVRYPTPDTSGYMVLGYAFIFLAIAIYLISLYIRQRSMKRDIELLEELGKKDKK
jgi:CcmD family protein